MEQIREACLACRAREFRVARSAEERDLLWKGRKNAFGAVGRVSPTYYVQDGVVPRTQIAPTLRHIGEVSAKYGLTISNIFHAGDGNMHPIILFNARKPGDLEKAQHAGDDILTYCISVGGSITGEHGVGMEKNELMARQFSSETLDMIGEPENALRPGMPPESRQGPADRPGLYGNPAARAHNCEHDVLAESLLRPGELLSEFPQDFRRGERNPLPLAYFDVLDLALYQRTILIPECGELFRIEHNDLPHAAIPILQKA